MLNIGDAVYLHAYFGNYLEKYVVVKTTPKQAVLENGVRLERDSKSTIYAHELGGKRQVYLLETDALKAAYEIQKEQQKFIFLTENCCRKLPLAKLREINAMLAEVAEQKTA
jgi:hypothetical protein